MGTVLDLNPRLEAARRARDAAGVSDGQPDWSTIVAANICLASMPILIVIHALTAIGRYYPPHPR